MSAPSAVAEFIECVKKSGLVDPNILDAYLQREAVASARAGTPKQLAEAMIRDALLTRFQAEQLLLGKWKNFVISGKYKLLERLGSGGMGSVFLCEHKVMRRRVALKVIPLSQAQDPAALERFHREARAVARLHHPNIVVAHDVDQDGKLHFLVMEYVEGSNLHEVVKKHGPLEVVRAAHYIRQAAVGLQNAHEAGLVHRDIKPGNLIVDRSGTVKILDLGLARFFHDESDNITQKYDESLLGTADYLAPEQALDSHQVDIRADIYSLGVTFYYLLTGAGLFKEGTITQKLLWHQMRQHRPVREIRPEVPEGMAAVIDRMLAKEPAQRYQTPIEVADALVPWTRTPIAPPPAAEMPQLSPAAREAGEHDRGSGTLRAVAATPSSFDTGPLLKTPLPSRASSGSQVELPALLTPPTQPSAATAPPPPGARPRLWTWLLVLAGGLLASGVVAGLWWTVFRPTPPPGGSSAPPKSDNPVSTGGLIVARSGPEGTYPTVREALAQAKPGDHILVQEEVLEESLLVRGAGGQGRDVVVEGAAPSGRPVTWQAPANLPQERALVELADVEGLRLKGLVLDGNNQLDHLVILSGHCPGLGLEDLQLQGFRRSAVKADHCTGEGGRPVSLQSLLVLGGPGSEAALVFEAGPGQFSRDTQVRDCRLAGPFKAVVRLNGPVADVEFVRNRLFLAEDGFLVPKRTPPSSLRLALISNTLSDLKTGLHFESLPPADGDNNRLVVQKNLFIETHKLATVDGLRTEPKSTPAQWIWCDEPDLHGGGFPAEDRFFRKTFDIAESPVTRATLDIACDDAFTAWVNGAEVGKSPFAYYTKHVYAFDVTAQLRAGRNVLAVRGSNLTDLMTGLPTNAALLAQLTFTAGKKPVTLATDKTWKASRTGPEGWQTLDFDDGPWPPARVLWPHGKESATYVNLPWDSVVQSQFQGGARPLPVAAAGNVRDFRSAEGYPPLEARGTNIPLLPTDPIQEGPFLRYPKTSPLRQADFPGVPPFEGPGSK